MLHMYVYFQEAVVYFRQMCMYVYNVVMGTNSDYSWNREYKWVKNIQ